MTDCLKKALTVTQLGTDGTAPPRLFMVNEAEAAAVHVLAASTTQLYLRSWAGRMSHILTRCRQASVSSC